MTPKLIHRHLLLSLSRDTLSRELSYDTLSHELSHDTTSRTLSNDTLSHYTLRQELKVAGTSISTSPYHQITSGNRRLLLTSMKSSATSVM